MPANEICAGRRARTALFLRHYLLDNPIATLEFRRLMRGRRAVYLVTFFLIVMASLCLLVHAGPTWAPLQSYLGNMPGSGVPGNADIGTRQFSAVCAALLYMLVAIMPGLFAAAVPREREGHVFDAVRASLLTPGQMISGRLVAGGAMALLLLAVGAPFLAVVFLTGGVGTGQMLAVLGALFIIAAFYAAAGLAAGSEFRGSTAAMLVAYIFCGFLTWPFLLLPMQIMRGVLRGEPWQIAGIAALVYLPPALLLIAIAREGLAGWHERGRTVRLVLLATVFFYPAIVYTLATRFYTTSFIPRSLCELFLIAGVIHYALCALACSRAPHPEQLRLPFFTALGGSLRLRNLLREDPLGAPAFMLLLHAIMLLIMLGLAVHIGAYDLMPGLFLIWLGMFTGIFAFGGFGLLLAFLLRTQRFFSAAMLGNVIVNIVLLFLAVAGVEYYKYETASLSVVYYFIEYAAKLRRSVVLPFNDGLESDCYVIVMLNIVIAYFAWHALYMLWQRHHRAGSYALQAETRHA